MKDDDEVQPVDSQDLSVGDDGLPVRDDGEWAEEKLYYIERYIQIFTTGMKSKWPRRVYIDLFTGPGRSRVRGTTQEFEGSPLRAAKAKYAFTNLFLNDADPAVTAALGARIDDSPRGRTTITTMDCNNAAVLAGDKLFTPRNRTSTLGLAVIDPTAFQISFDAIKRMTGGRRIDLIITFMTGYLRRFIDQPSYAPQLDAFFGSGDWRRFVDVRAEGRRITFGALLEFYKDRLRTIDYIHVDDHVRILNTKSNPIYHLIFASKNPKGQEFFEKISRRQFTGQHRMALE
ncbi:MAG: three-Cys-motif partner protein TcmP [Dehalococcoidia bacterium]